jgi:hypothetical protein
MAAQATVSLVVDESGTVAGLTRFQQRAMASFKGPRAEALALNEQIARLAVSIDGLAASGKKAGDAQAAGHDKANAHALTNLDTVRLLRDDLGVRIPRAMEKLISQTAAFQAIASTAFSAFALVGVLELVGTIGGKIGDWAHYLMGDTKALQDFRKELVAANDEARVNTPNSFVAMKSLADYNKEIADLERRQKAVHTPFVSAIAETLTSHTDIRSGEQDVERNAFTGDDEAILQKDYAERKQLQMNDSQRRKQINADDLKQQREISEIGLENIRKVEQARKNAHAAIFDRVHGTNDVTPDLAPDQGKREDALIDQKAAAERLALETETQREIRRMRAETAAIGLKGEKEINAQGAAEIAGLSTKDAAYGAKKLEIERQTAAKIEALRKDAADKTHDMNEQAVLAGLTGNARVLEEERHSNYETNRLASESLITEEDAQNRRADAHIIADAQIRKSLEDYAKAERQMRDSLDVSGSKGYNHIGAENTRMQDDALDRYKKQVDGMDETDERRTQAYATYQADLRAIAAKTENDIKDLHQRNLDETANLEDQAASVRSGAQKEGLFGLFAQEQDQTRRITAEYEKRERHLQESLKDGVLSHQEAAQQQAALDDLRNAQMEEQQRGLRDKLASSIEQGFKDPFGSIQNEMKHEMATIIADWIMQLSVFKRFFGSSMSGTLSGGQGGGQSQAPGGLLGALMQRHGTSHAARQGTSSDVSPASEHAAAVSSVSSIGGVTGPSGTIEQALIAPGVSSTNTGSGISTSDTVGVGGVVGSSMLSGASSIADTGLSLARAMHAARGLRAGGGSAADALNSGANQTRISNSYATADNGEDGGFAGYLTGDSDPTTSNPFGSDLSGTQDVNSAAASQVQTANQDIAAAGVDNGLSTGMTVAGAAMGAYGGAKGVISSFESGKASGILTGAESGAELGGSIGMLAGPLGAAIGAGVGALGGAAVGLVGWATGEGGRIGGAKYFKDTMRPEMEQVETTYMSGGGGDALSAISQLNSTSAQGYLYLAKQFGYDAAAWVKTAYIDKERNKVTSDINRLALGGRDYTARSAAEFHDGGVITGFGDWGTSSNEGMIHALLDETVMNRQASVTHGPVLGAMNSGASPAEIAGMYLERSAAAGGAAAATQYHQHDHTLNAIDAASFEQFLKRRGGMDAIARATTKRNTQQGGDSD